MFVSVHLKKPHNNEFDILSQNMTLDWSMDFVHEAKAQKVIIRQDNNSGSLILYSDGTWAFISNTMVVQKSNLE